MKRTATTVMNTASDWDFTQSVQGNLTGRPLERLFAACLLNGVRLTTHKLPFGRSGRVEGDEYAVRRALIDGGFSGPAAQLSDARVETILNEVYT